MLRFDHNKSNEPIHPLSSNSKADTMPAPTRVSFTCHHEEIELSSKLIYSDDTSSTFTATLQSSKNRVQFKVDPSNKEHVYCSYYPNEVELSRDEARSLWYRSSEIKEMRRVVFTEALAARESMSSSYLQQFDELNSSCGKSLSVIALPYHLAKEVAGSQYRGCESYIFIELLRPKQCCYIQEVLSIQEYFFGSSDQLEKELYTVSSNLSEQSRRLAFMMGIGDANVASNLVSSRERGIAIAARNRVPISKFREVEGNTNYETLNDLVGPSQCEI